MSASDGGHTRQLYVEGEREIVGMASFSTLCSLEANEGVGGDQTQAVFKNARDRDEQRMRKR